MDDNSIAKKMNSAITTPIRVIGVLTYYVRHPFKTMSADSKIETGPRSTL